MRQKALKPIGSLFVDPGQSALPSSSNSWHKKPSGASRWARSKYTQLLDTRTPLWGGLSAYEQTRGLQHFNSLICFILGLMEYLDNDRAARWNLTFLPSPRRSASAKGLKTWGKLREEVTKGSGGSELTSVSPQTHNPHIAARSPRSALFQFLLASFTFLCVSASVKWFGAQSETISSCFCKDSHSARWFCHYCWFALRQGLW